MKVNTSDNFEEIKTGLLDIQQKVNSFAKGAKTEERKQYLNFLWAVYDSLPAVYIHPTDVTLCNFPDVADFDSNSLLAILGDRVASFLSCNYEDLPRVATSAGEEPVTAYMPDADSKISIYLCACDIFIYLFCFVCLVGIATEYVTRFNSHRGYSTYTDRNKARGITRKKSLKRRGVEVKAEPSDIQLLHEESCDRYNRAFLINL